VPIDATGAEIDRKARRRPPRRSVRASRPPAARSPAWNADPLYGALRGRTGTRHKVARWIRSR